MRKTKRLGRGLEDISHYFISRNPAITSEHSSLQDSSCQRHYKSVSIVDMFNPQRGASLAATVGIELSQKGIKVLLIDADLRFPGIAFILGLSVPGFSFEHYYQERYEPSDIVYTGPYGIKLLAPHLNKNDCTSQGPAKKSLMIDTLISIEKEIDIVIIRQNEDFINPIIDEALFVVPALTTSLLSLYKAMKKFAIGDDRKMAGVLVSDAEDEATAFGVFENISNCTEMSCGVRPFFIGNLTNGQGEGSILNPLCISNIVSRLTEISLQNREITSKKRLFFEKFRLLANVDDVTLEEMKCLVATSNSCENRTPDTDLYFY